MPSNDPNPRSKGPNDPPGDASSTPTGSQAFYRPAVPPPAASTPRQTLSSHIPAEKPGDHIGPYKLLELLGEGGFGSVWAAEQMQPLKRRVALKLLHHGMDSRTILARFEQERQALAMMDHPNIARVLDAGATESGRPYFVMELVRGVPITQYCDAAKLTPRKRMELMQQVCRAVQHAHTKGIIHRDIKPGNVLVTLHADQPVPKVIDFGIAKATTQPLTDKTIYTEFRQLIGTPPYMSPEQAEMSGLDIDTRTDIYALGALMYELLTGSPPLDPEALRKAGIAEVYRLIKETEPPKPSTKVSTIGGRLREVAGGRGTEPGKLSALLRGEPDWIVMKAMEKDRTRRYETADGLAADIGRYLTGEAVLAGPPSAAYRVRRFVRRHRGAVVTACAVAGTLIAGIAATTWQWAEARKANALLTSQNQGVIESLTELVRTLQLVEPERTWGHYTLPDGRKVTIVRRKGENWKTEVRILPGHVPSPESALDRPQPEIDPDFAMQTLALIVEDNAMKMYDQTVIAKQGKARLEAANAELQVEVRRARLAEASSVLQYDYLGEGPQYADPLREALAAREEYLGPYHIDTINAMWKVTDYLEYAAHITHSEAARARREAVDRLRFLGWPGEFGTMQLLVDEAARAISRGCFDEAEDLLGAAVEQLPVVDTRYEATRFLSGFLISKNIIDTYFYSYDIHGLTATDSAAAIDDVLPLNKAALIEKWISGGYWASALGEPSIFWQLTKECVASQPTDPSAIGSLAVIAWNDGDMQQSLLLSEQAEAARWHRAMLPNSVIRCVRAMSLFKLGRTEEARRILGQVQENMKQPWANQQPGATDYLKAAEQLIGDPSEVAPASSR
jgi:serine/threonine protein kinase